MKKRRKVCGRPPSSAVELPSDVIFSHILPRLSASSLMRFKHVCKDWSSRIRSSSFVAAYSNFRRNKNTITTNLILKSQRFRGLFSSQIDQQGIPTPTVRLLGDYGYAGNPQSINGLICARYTCSIDSPVVIFNPTTRESTKLPHLTFPDKLDPNRIYLFGYTPLMNQYKVLQIIVFASEVSFRVFTLGEDSWRPLHVDLTTFPTFDLEKFRWLNFGSPMCLHGTIHWIDYRQKNIMVFDVAEETFGLIQIPTSTFAANWPYSSVVRMVEVEGCLGLFIDISIDREGREREHVLWILEDYKNHGSWVKKTIEPSIPTTKSYRSACAWFTIHTGELAIVLRRGIDSIPELHLYDMKKRLYRQLEFDVLTGDSTIEVISSYVDSIVPVK